MFPPRSPTAIRPLIWIRLKRIPRRTLSTERPPSECAPQSFRILLPAWAADLTNVRSTYTGTLHVRPERQPCTSPRTPTHLAGNPKLHRQKTKCHEHDPCSRAKKAPNRVSLPSIPLQDVSANHLMQPNANSTVVCMVPVWPRVRPQETDWEFSQSCPIAFLCAPPYSSCAHEPV